MAVKFDHGSNTVSQRCADIAIKEFLSVEENLPESVLDIGTGTGEWSKSLIKYGIADVFGVDGILTKNALEVLGDSRIQKIDLNYPFCLNRKFDLAICLEVGEHLIPSSSLGFVQSIANHTDKVIFSAAIPDQPGYRHINCQPPAYWQSLFNQCGFVCEDLLRPRLSRHHDVLWWYRQNCFFCRKDEDKAGSEPRIIHWVAPECLSLACSLAQQEAKLINKLRKIVKQIVPRRVLSLMGKNYTH